MTGGIVHRRFAPAGAAVAVSPARGGSRSSIATITGYAARFNETSHDLGGFREIIRPGAFTAALRSPTHPILALHDHVVGQLLGNTAAGTLRLREDRVGLWFEVDLPPTSLGRDVLTLAERGDLRGCSFGFTLRAGGTEWKKVDGKPVQIIRSVGALREVSIVSLPAYAAAGIETIAPPAKPKAERSVHPGFATMRAAVAASVG